MQPPVYSYREHYLSIDSHSPLTTKIQGLKEDTKLPSSCCPEIQQKNIKTTQNFLAQPLTLEALMSITSS